jgi:hypothetical protein
MPTTPDFMVLYGLLLCFALYLLYKYIVKNSVRQKKQLLLERIKSIRLDSIKLQEEVNNYILAQNAGLEAMPGGVTVNQFYRQLKHNHVVYLSSKLIEKLQNTDNPMLIKKTSNELDNQEAKLKEAQALFESILKPQDIIL